MWNRVELKEKGRKAFKRNYWMCVAVALVLVVLAGGNNGGVEYEQQYDIQTNVALNQAVNNGYGVFSSYMPGSVNSLLAASGMGIIGVVGIAFSLLVANVVIVGGRRFYTKNSWQPAEFKEILFGFNKDCYFNIVQTMFIANLQIVFWTLVFVVPGIIKSYEYYMVPYILADDPYLDYHDALALSKKMMDGHKWNTFLLELSFVGWEILSAMSFGLVGVFYGKPYRNATLAELYITLRDNISDSFSDEI